MAQTAKERYDELKELIPFPDEFTPETIEDYLARRDAMLREKGISNEQWVNLLIASLEEQGIKA